VSVIWLTYKRDVGEETFPEASKWSQAARLEQAKDSRTDELLPDSWSKIMFEQQLQTQTGDGPKKPHHNILHEVQDHAKKLLHTKAGHVIQEGAKKEANKIVKNETDGATGGIDLVKTVTHAAKTGHVDKKDLGRAVQDAGKVVSATPIGLHKMIIGDAAKEALKFAPKSVQPTVQKVEKVMDLKKAIKHGDVNKVLNTIKTDDIYKSVHNTQTQMKS
jgi:hypothetical protein